MSKNTENTTVIPELQDLVGAAAAADATGQTEQPQGAESEPGGPEVAQPSQTPEQDARQIIDLLAWAVEQVFPVLGYKEETKDEGAKRLAPLLVKYNLQQSLFGTYGAEIQAGMFFGGVVYASIQVVGSSGDEAAQAEHKKSWFAKFLKWGK